MTTRAAVQQANSAVKARAHGPVTGPASDFGPGRVQRILRAVAVIATVPYLVLKAAWLSGSHIGIPEGSVLLKGGLFLTVANAVTVAMDAAVIVLALLLTRPWGRRVPGRLLLVPAFTATGLLTPIMTAFPGQMLVRALGMGAGEAVEAAREPFLDPWVFTVVYGGFTIQGLALAGLFVPYARRRWGRVWQGVLGTRLPLPTGVVAGAAAALGTAVGAIHLYWAFGGSAGLGAQRAALYSAETGVVSGVHAVCALLAGLGALLLARGGARRAWWPLALAWIGAAEMLAWGLFLVVAALGPDLGPGDGTPVVIFLTYAGQVVTGCLGAVVLARFAAARRAAV